MKILKKIAAAMAAMSMAIGAVSIPTFAENAYYLKFISSGGNVGDTIPVNIVIDLGNTSISGIIFKLNYNPSELQQVEVKLGTDNGWQKEALVELKEEPVGIITFSHLTLKPFSLKSAELLKTSFKVLKPGAKLTLTEVSIADGNFEEITTKGSYDKEIVITAPSVSTTSVSIIDPPPAVTTPVSSPAVTTPVSSSAASSPAVTTPAPAVTTPAPAVTTPAPAVTTPAPAVTTPAPAATTPAPAATTPAPVTTTPAPSADSDNNGASIVFSDNSGDKAADVQVIAKPNTIPNGASFSVRVDNANTTDGRIAYDLSFTYNGALYQPTDAVTVKIPVPASMNNIADTLKVYHFNNGTYVNMNAKAENGFLIFDTNHFSTYVVTSESLGDNSDKTSPNTGVSGISLTAGAVLAMGTVMIIARRKRK